MNLPDNNNRCIATNGKDRFVVVIPLYNHADKVADVIRGALDCGLPVIVVDDGSTDAPHEKIRHIQGITLLRHPENKGKGAALITGMTAAAGSNYDWAVTIDADGQHDPQDISELIAAIPENQRPIILGRRRGMNAPDVLWTSRYGRKFSDFWILLSGGGPLQDSQSGFRIYPLPETLHLNVKSGGYQFEIEVLVKAAWHKIPVVEAPVRVYYQPGEKRVSHFRPLIDFLKNSRTFARLIFQRFVLTASRRGQI
jgi:glycosyltransferase involved in cell wall biosynthesis